MGWVYFQQLGLTGSEKKVDSPERIKNIITHMNTENSNTYNVVLKPQNILKVFLFLCIHLKGEQLFVQQKVVLLAIFFSIGSTTLFDYNYLAFCCFLVTY